MREGYKDSPLGEIPHSWEVVRFEDKTEILTCGVAATPIYVDKSVGVPFLSAQNVKNGKVVLDKYKYISKDHHIELTKKNKPRIGDILYSRVGAKFGEAAVVEQYFEFSVYVSLTHIRVKPTVDSYFVKHLLNSSNVKNLALRSVFQGAGVPNLNVKVVREFRLAFPPLAEQQKIAEILSTVDEKIEVIDQQITETQALKKGLMQSLLTKGIGHTEFKDSPLGEIPKSWEVVKVGEVCKLKGGFAFKSTDSCDSGIRWMKIANVGVNRIKWADESFLPLGFEVKHNDFLLKKGDVVIAMTRPILSGKLKIAQVNEFDSGSLLNQRVGRLVQADELDLEFAYQFFNSSSFITAMEKELLGTDPPNISSVMFEDLYITLPSLVEQKEIANILSSVDEKLEVQQEKKAHYQELKKGLMQQLLTGKVRVIV